jgi:5'-3' exoribonuclease 2
MNGIIHPCTHPASNSEIPSPKNFEEMKRNIHHYIDLVISKTRPKKLVYFAVDGVAPKAKLT